MMLAPSRQGARRSGSALIGALFAVLILSILMMGMGTFAVSHMARARADLNYARALDLAEAGANYEFNKITLTPTSAGSKAAPDGPPSGFALSSIGTFSVYCVTRNADGSDGGNWTPPGKLYVYSTGIVNAGKPDEVRRTIKVSVKGYGSTTTANYAVFGVSQGLMNGTATTVDGDIGTNGFFNFNGKPVINGKVIFNGSTAGWQSPPVGTYNEVHNTDPVVWPTVTDLANQAFPSGGLSYIATHNDNALCVDDSGAQVITGNQILLNGNKTANFYGKPGGANYYLTSLLLNGTSQVAFKNANGPINIWMGPPGSAGNNIFNGGTAAVKMSDDPTKAVRIYVANTNDVILNGNTRLDAGIYDYNGSGAPGRVIFNGNQDIYGSVIANMFTFNGTPHVYYKPGYFNPNSSGPGYYGYDDLWTEQSGR